MMDKHRMPIFVKVDEYKDVLDVMGLIKNKLKQAKDTLRQIDQLRKQEDDEIEVWRSNIDEVERKIEEIDHSLFEPDIP